jgi:chromosome segregation ATPase
VSALEKRETDLEGNVRNLKSRINTTTKIYQREKNEAKEAREEFEEEIGELKGEKEEADENREELEQEIEGLKTELESQRQVSEEKEGKLRTTMNKYKRQLEQTKTQLSKHTESHKQEIVALESKFIDEQRESFIRYASKTNRLINDHEKAIEELQIKFVREKNEWADELIALANLRKREIEKSTATSSGQQADVSPSSSSSHESGNNPESSSDGADCPKCAGYEPDTSGNLEGKCNHTWNDTDSDDETVYTPSSSEADSEPTP